MSEAMKNRTWYFTALRMWLEHFSVEMTQDNREQIYDKECEFNGYWVAAGHQIPDGRKLSQIYYGM